MENNDEAKPQYPPVTETGVQGQPTQNVVIIANETELLGTELPMDESLPEDNGTEDPVTEPVDSSTDEASSPTPVGPSEPEEA